MPEPAGEQLVLRLQWIDPERDHDIAVPGYETPGSAGLDVCAAVQHEVTLQPGERCLLPTGFAVALPQGYEIQVRPRSGLAVKHGVTVVNAPGTIDSDYRGEVRIALINLGSKPYTIKRGDRVAQLIVAPVVQVGVRVCPELDRTQRGSGGFGHTGV